VSSFISFIVVNLAALTVMAAVPSATDTVTSLPGRYTLADCGHNADDLVARDKRPRQQPC
jgi:hypothetical protein